MRLSLEHRVSGFPTQMLPWDSVTAPVRTGGICSAQQPGETCWKISPFINGEFRPIFQGISSQNMAKHMVLTYLHQLDPEITIEFRNNSGLWFPKCFRCDDGANWFAYLGGMSWIPKQKQIYKRVLSRHGWPLVIIIIPYDPGSYQHKWRVNRHICRRFWCFWRSAPWMNPKFGRRDPAFWMIKRIISWILFPCVNRRQWISNSQISLKMNRIIEVTLAFFHILFIFGMSKTLVPF